MHCTLHAAVSYVSLLKFQRIHKFSRTLFSFLSPQKPRTRRLQVAYDVWICQKRSESFPARITWMLMNVRIVSTFLMTSAHFLLALTALTGEMWLFRTTKEVDALNNMENLSDFMIIHDGGGVKSLALINIMLIWREIMWQSSPKKKRREKSKVSRVSRALSAVMCV